MPSTSISAPASTPSVDRLSLGVAATRQGATTAQFPYNCGCVCSASSEDSSCARGWPLTGARALAGDRAGQHSIRINDQWRVCFTWTERGASDVEIVDYH